MAFSQILNHSCLSNYDAECQMFILFILTKAANKLLLNLILFIYKNDWTPIAAKCYFVEFYFKIKILSLKA